MLTYEKTDDYALSISDAAMHRLATETANATRTARLNETTVKALAFLVTAVVLLGAGNSILEMLR